MEQRLHDLGFFVAAFVVFGLDYLREHPRVIQTPPDPTVNAVFATTGAHLYYEVRGAGPGLLLVGCPMDATAFAPLADLLAVDHTVITTDPRGINRSSVDDPDQDVTPEMLAEDLSQLLNHLNLGPVAVFGSSGGAVARWLLRKPTPIRCTQWWPTNPRWRNCSKTAPS